MKVSAKNKISKPNSKSIANRILLSSIIGVGAVGLIISAYFTYVLYIEVLNQQKILLQYSLETSKTTMDQKVAGMVEVSLQISSRTTARKLLEDAVNERIDRKAAISKLKPILEEAILRGEGILGITRYDKFGKVFIHLGDDGPDQLPFSEFSLSQNQPKISYIKNKKGGLKVLSPILTNDNSIVGYDLVSFSTSSISDLLKDLNKNEQDQYGIILIDKEERSYFRSSEDTSLLEEKLDDIDLSHISSSVEIRGWIILATEMEQLSAYMVRMVNKSIILKIVRENIVPTVILVASLVLLSVLFMTLKLKPLTNSIIIGSNELESIVEERTRELALANQSKDDFLANVSHEIRTPMNGILGSIQLLEDENFDSEVRNHLETIKMSAETMTNLLNDILDISKLEAGKIELEIIPTNLAALFTSCYQLFKSHADEKLLDFEIIGIEDLNHHYHCDPTRIQQVLFNLLSNAIKFTEKGFVHLSIQADKVIENKQLIHISVKDSGIGIDPVEQKKVFERFSQADSSINRKYGGTGLGLFISRQLVQLMGGELRLVSSKGNGSEFSFNLMLPILTSAEKVEKNNFSLNRNYKAKILIAEDQPVNIKVIVKLLEKLGVEALVASNGTELISLAEKDQEHQLIFTDIQMPQIDGIEATLRLRQLGYKKPIIALTANVMKEQIQKYISSGMQDCLPKPLKRQDVVRILDTYLDK